MIDFSYKKDVNLIDYSNTLFAGYILAEGEKTEYQIGTIAANLCCLHNHLQSGEQGEDFALFLSVDTD